MNVGIEALLESSLFDGADKQACRNSDGRTIEAIVLVEVLRGSCWSCYRDDVVASSASVNALIGKALKPIGRRNFRPKLASVMVRTHAKLRCTQEKSHFRHPLQTFHPPAYPQSSGTSHSLFDCHGVAAASTQSQPCTPKPGSSQFRATKERLCDAREPQRKDRKHHVTQRFNGMLFFGSQL